MKPFTKNELISDIRDLMIALADGLERVTLPGSGLGLLGLNRADFPATNANGGAFGIVEVDADQIDPGRWRLTGVLLDMYDYGIHGIRSVAAQTWLDFATDVETFLHGMQHFPLLEETHISVNMERIWYVLSLATARWKLDDDEGASDVFADNREGHAMLWGVLTLGEVALLAGMDEKSVRNAANPKLKNALKTVSQGNRTYVRTSDARAWLAGRRGFTPSVNINPNEGRDLARGGFFDVQDFASYIAWCRDKLALTSEHLAHSIGLPDWPATRVGALEDEGFTFDPAMLKRLASALQLDPKTFVLACLALQQRLERRALEEQLEDESDQGATSGPAAA